MTSGIHVEIVMMNSSIQPIHIASHHKKKYRKYQNRNKYSNYTNSKVQIN